MFKRKEQEIMKDWKGDLVTPVVSICCTTYNHESYISKAIDGFLMQETDFPFEILIRDDCSTDQTAKIIKEYADKYPTLIKPIYKKENTFSKGVKPMPQLYKIAKGKYIALCEGDDYWIDPLKLQKQVDFLEKNLYTSLVFTNRKTLQYINNTIKEHDNLYEKKDYTIDDVFAGFTVPTQTVMIRRENLNEFYKLIENVEGINGDRLLTYWAVQVGKISLIEDITSYYRYHGLGVWSSIPQKEKYKKQIEACILFSTQLQQLDNPGYKKRLYSLIIRYMINHPFSFIRFISGLKNSHFSMKEFLTFFLNKLIIHTLKVVK